MEQHSQVSPCANCKSMNTTCNIIDTIYENRRFKCKIICNNCRTLRDNHILCPSTPEISKDHISSSTPLRNVIPTFTSN